MEESMEIRGFVDIEHLDKDDNVVHTEVIGHNLVLNNFRRTLPLLLAPQIVEGRLDNSEGGSTWLGRRIALVGVGVGDNGDPPTVKPEDPEDGVLYLVGESSYPNSQWGLQTPIRRVPITPGAPSDIYDSAAAETSDAIHFLKEVDSDGVEIIATPGAGAEIVFTFTVEEDEYIGNVMEYCLYMGGGDPGSSDRETRLDRDNALVVSRKTRASKFESTSDSKFRIVWRLRT